MSSNEDRIRPIAVYFGDYLTTDFTLNDDLLVQTFQYTQANSAFSPSGVCK